MTVNSETKVAPDKSWTKSKMNSATSALRMMIYCENTSNWSTTPTARTRTLKRAPLRSNVSRRSCENGRTSGTLIKTRMRIHLPSPRPWKLGLKARIKWSSNCSLPLKISERSSETKMLKLLICAESASLSRWSRCIWRSRHWRARCKGWHAGMLKLLTCLRAIIIPFRRPKTWKTTIPTYKRWCNITINVLQILWPKLMKSHS